jgi:hypothetical protein
VNNSPSNRDVDGVAALGLCVFGFIHFAVLFIAGYVVTRRPDPGETEQQRMAAFGVYMLFVSGASFVALGSHAAALAWSRRRFRSPQPGMLVVLQVAIATVSAGLLLLSQPERTSTLGALLILLLGPANITLATYAAVNLLLSRDKRGA